MKLTPRSTARRRVLIEASWSLGGPQMPGPVMRMAPKPRRLTVRSPRLTVPAAAALGAAVVVGMDCPLGDWIQETGDRAQGQVTGFRLQVAGSGFVQWFVGLGVVDFFDAGEGVDFG